MQTKTAERCSHNQAEQVISLAERYAEMRELDIGELSLHT